MSESAWEEAKRRFPAHVELIDAILDTAARIFAREERLPEEVARAFLVLRCVDRKDEVQREVAEMVERDLLAEGWIEI